MLIVASLLVAFTFTYVIYRLTEEPAVYVYIEDLSLDEEDLEVII